MFNLIVMTTSSLLALIFTMMNHPLAMGLMLLLQTLTICLMTGMITQSFWFSYILFLVFLGGLLVLFIYVTSLASNEMFSLSTSLTLLITGPMFVIILIILLTDPMTWLNMINSTETTDILANLTNLEEAAPSLIKLYNQPTGMITLLLVLYLFLTLIAVVKITNIFQGPLRQKN